jgi:RHS repeat-associated protein
MMIVMSGAYAGTYYYHFDGLGSIIALSNSSGAVVEQYTYDVFGTPDSVSSIGNPYLFTGREYDSETGNYYYRARYYAPDIGRFLQPDPTVYKEGLNLYTYGRNNPVGFFDPIGLASVAVYDPADEGSGGKFTTGRQFKAAAKRYNYAIAATSPEAALVEIKALKERGVIIDDLYIFDHGGAGFQDIGNKVIVSTSNVWKEMANAVEPGGEIHLRGCGVANSDQGWTYLQNLADYGKRRIDAYAGGVTYGKGIFGGIYFSTSTLWEAAPGKGCPSVKRRGFSISELILTRKITQ